jgi:hypothetical protein
MGSRVWWWGRGFDQVLRLPCLRETSRVEQGIAFCLRYPKAAICCYDSYGCLAFGAVGSKRQSVDSTLYPALPAEADCKDQHFNDDWVALLH